MLAAAALDTIETQFNLALDKAPLVNKMALYLRHESEGRLHCELVIYLYTTSTELPREIGANPCLEPSLHDLGLLAGGN